MNVLEARGICKSFGRRQVLAGVDLAVAAGEMAAVVGENGSGKSITAPEPGSEQHPRAPPRPGAGTTWSSKTATADTRNVSGIDHDVRRAGRRRPLAGQDPHPVSGEPKRPVRAGDRLLSWPTRPGA